MTEQEDKQSQEIDDLLESIEEAEAEELCDEPISFVTAGEGEYEPPVKPTPGPPGTDDEDDILG